MEISNTKRILAHYGISIEKLCSKDDDVQNQEVEKFVNYLSKEQHMSPEQIEQFFTDLKIEFLNMMDD